MVHETHLPASRDAGRSSASRSRPRIAIRLVERRRRLRAASQPPLLPLIGPDDVVLPAFDAKLGEVARRAQAGDAAARDALFFAFQPKLARLSYVVRPPFAPEGARGVWDRDDVAQEAYLVFVDLVLGWPGDVPLTPYLMARFPWRLRDAIRRGVARPTVPPRGYAVPVELADDVEDAAGASEDVRELLETVVAGLPAPLDAILVGHVLHGRTKAEISREIGVSRRTMARYWREIQRRTLDLLA